MYHHLLGLTLQPCYFSSPFFKYSRTVNNFLKWLMWSIRPSALGAGSSSSNLGSGRMRSPGLKETCFLNKQVANLFNKTSLISEYITDQSNEIRTSSAPSFCACNSAGALH